MRKIKVLSLAFLCGVLALGITKPAKAISEAVTLSATPNPAKNSISLQWNNSDKSQPYSYRLYSKSDKDSNFQSIPAKNSIKVLNVYPDAAGTSSHTDTFVSSLDGKTYTTIKSAALKMWMEAANSECSQGYGKGHISVDSIPITSFDWAPSDTLHNPDGSYKYDAIFFGAWDVNGGYDLCDYALPIVERFVDSGRGLLLGHDTACAIPGVPSAQHPNFCTLADRYINMYSGLGYAVPDCGNTTVTIKKKGLLTDYPWPIGDVGTTLTVPMSHTCCKIAMGDIWIKYVNEAGQGSEVNTYNGVACTNNFYLSTWNNAAMIQTGHSCGQATPDEQKILANTLFYLAQITTDTSWNDHKGQDLAAPDKPVISSVTHNDDLSRYTVNYTASKDNGTNYQYYVEATGQSDGRKYTSTTVPAKITSGIAGYKVIADHSPDTVVSGTADTASTCCSFSRPDGPTFYVHVAAVDNAGNVSDTATYFVDESLSLTHPSSITYKIDPNSNTPFMSAEIPITNNSTIPVKVFVQGVSNASGGTLTLNNVPSSKYPDWNKLTVAQTKADAAFSVRIKEASTGPGTWSSISQGGTVNTSSMSKTLMGTISAKGTGTLILTADCGLAWDRQYTALQNLSLVFES